MKGNQVELFKNRDRPDGEGLPIGVREIRDAAALLRKYKDGKASIDARVIENEQWYRMRHWNYFSGNAPAKEVRPTSAWLFNCIRNKHADAMDAYPAPDVLPREPGDREEAEMLSAIIPVILSENDFEETYSAVWDAKLKSGTGVYGVFWDKNACGGLGDVAVRRVDVLNLFWEPGVSDIQHSRNLFHCELADTDILTEAYPSLREKIVRGRGALSGGDTVSRYVFDDTVDTSGKTLVVDWYYKKRQNGREVLHYVKFAGDAVLFATENEERYRSTGLYAHAKYPFVFDVLFPVEGSPAGFGYIDVGKDAQEYIDRGGQAVMQSMLAASRPRHFIRTDGAVNEAEYADYSRDFIHVDGNLGEDSVRQVQVSPVSETCVRILENKIEELKETTGTRDVSTGGSAGNVIAASAIAALQEAGSKITRDTNKSAYRAFRRVCLLTVELIRQFYDTPRKFRILGRDGFERFVSYTNAGIVPSYRGEEYGVDLGWSEPLFDIEISAGKASPYSKLSQNELALQFYKAGFFDPARRAEALACLDMMDFDKKSLIVEKIGNSANAEVSSANAEDTSPTPSLGESPITEKARKTVANAVLP